MKQNGKKIVDYKIPRTSRSKFPPDYKSMINAYNEYTEYTTWYNGDVDIPISDINRYLATQIVTDISNNMKMHFTQHLSRLINLKFKVPKYKRNAAPEEKEINSLARKSANGIKADLFTNGDQKYTGAGEEWINANRRKFIPENIGKKNHIAYHVKSNPLELIDYSLRINKAIEKLGHKPYQVFPQKKSNVPGYVTIPYVCIVKLLGNEFASDVETYIKSNYPNEEQLKLTKSNLSVKATTHANYVFETLFNKKIIDRPGYELLYIMTDGIYASLCYQNFKLSFAERKGNKKGLKKVTDHAIAEAKRLNAYR
jgi:hypothetical protein